MVLLRFVEQITEFIMKQSDQNTVLDNRFCWFVVHTQRAAASNKATQHRVSEVSSSFMPNAVRLHDSREAKLEAPTNDVPSDDALSPSWTVDFMKTSSKSSASMR